MEYSHAGMVLTEGFEGLKLSAYLDSIGKPTIGYGHTRGVKMGDVITQAQAEQFLHDDIQNAVNDVNRLLRTQVSQNQFDALVDFDYNVGGVNFANSTLLKLVNTNQFDKAALEFDKWNKAGGNILSGLTRRRDAEEDLFTA